jgi:hypothetical protein
MVSVLSFRTVKSALVVPAPRKILTGVTVNAEALASRAPTMRRPRTHTAK